MAWRMKVTALMDEQLVDSVRMLSGGKNTTESLVIALTDWLRIQKIKQLNGELEKKPLEFAENFSATKVRRLNRRKKT